MNKKQNGEVERGDESDDEDVRALRDHRKKVFGKPSTEPIRLVSVPPADKPDNLL